MNKSLLVEHLSHEVSWKHTDDVKRSTYTANGDHKICKGVPLDALNYVGTVSESDLHDERTFSSILWCVFWIVSSSYVLTIDRKEPLKFDRGLLIKATPIIVTNQYSLLHLHLYSLLESWYCWSLHKIISDSVNKSCLSLHIALITLKLWLFKGEPKVMFTKICLYFIRVGADSWILAYFEGDLKRGRIIIIKGVTIIVAEAVKCFEVWNTLTVVDDFWLFTLFARNYF